MIQHKRSFNLSQRGVKAFTLKRAGSQSVLHNTAKTDSEEGTLKSIRVITLNFTVTEMIMMTQKDFFFCSSWFKVRRMMTTLMLMNGCSINQQLHYGTKNFFQEVCQEQFLVAAASDICCVQQDSS